MRLHVVARVAYVTALTKSTHRCSCSTEQRQQLVLILVAHIVQHVRHVIKLLYGPGIAFPGLARLRDIVHKVSFYNIYADTEPPRARPGPPRPSSASGGPPAAARCGGVTNPTTEHRDAVGRSEVQLGVCIAHPGLSPGPINRRLRRRGHEVMLCYEVLFTPWATIHAGEYIVHLPAPS